MSGPPWSSLLPLSPIVLIPVVVLSFVLFARRARKPSHGRIVFCVFGVRNTDEEQLKIISRDCIFFLCDLVIVVIV